MPFVRVTGRGLFVETVVICGYMSSEVCRRTLNAVFKTYIDVVHFKKADANRCVITCCIAA